MGRKNAPDALAERGEVAGFLGPEIIDQDRQRLGEGHRSTQRHDAVLRGLFCQDQPGQLEQAPRRIDRRRCGVRQFTGLERGFVGVDIANRSDDRENGGAFSPAFGRKGLDQRPSRPAGRCQDRDVGQAFRPVRCAFVEHLPGHGTQEVASGRKREDVRCRT